MMDNGTGLEKSNLPVRTEDHFNQQNSGSAPGVGVPPEGGMISRSLANVGIFFSMLNDLLKGRYRKFPWWTVLSMIFAFFYVINPLDLFPDFIPFIGQIDDAAVLILSIRMIGNDLKKYKLWKSSNNL